MNMGFRRSMGYRTLCVCGLGFKGWVLEVGEDDGLRDGRRCLLLYSIRWIFLSLGMVLGCIYEEEGYVEGI